MQPFGNHFGTMASLTIKGLPDRLYRQIKERAASNRRSVNGEVISILEDAVGARRVDVEQILAEARALRRLTADHPITTEEIDAAIAHGRP